MALPATHLRLAVDLVDRFSINSERQYYSGTLYPDSRWLTGVDRRNSHSQACCQPEFVVDDFTLGWHVHCRCDIVQTDLFFEQFPDLMHLNEDKRWLHLSVYKMLQDREDMTAFDLDSALEKLTHVLSPNGEDPQKVKAYLDLVSDTYFGKKRLDMDDYHKLWIGVGLAPSTAAAIMDETRRMADAPRLIEQLQTIYPRIIGRFFNSAP